MRKCTAVHLIAFSALLLLAVKESQAQQSISFRVAGWNMESGESSDSFLQMQIGEKDGIDLWGFTEVRNDEALQAFEIGAEQGERADFERILGASGGADRMGIVYNTTRLQLLEQSEIEPNDPNLFRRHRKPLIAKFRGVTTGIEFIFMVNHLARGDAGARKAQARFLNSWALSQSDPIIAVGDYNFDYHVSFGDGGDRDAAFDELVEDGRWVWVKPTRLTKTQASDRFNSVLDFVFVANPLSNWSATSTILSRAGDAPAPIGDFDDDREATDHRPVDAIFTARLANRLMDRREDEGLTSESSREALEVRLEALESEAREIRALLTE